MNSPIRITETHDYYQGSLGEISVPKHTRICTMCGKGAFMNADEISYHRQHGGKLVRKVKHDGVNCGFDRTASHSTGQYVCACGNP